MLILFTSNEAGGVLQLAAQVLKEEMELGQEVLCFIPKGAKVTLSEQLKPNVIFYNKVKSLNPKAPEMVAVANSIFEKDPNLVWFFDNGIVSSQMAILLAKKIDFVMTMHDAGGSHPTNHVSIKDRLKRMYETRIGNIACDKATYILLLSEESRKKYVLQNPMHRDKVKVLNLGAHVPEISEFKPNEIKEEIKNYILFFGNIDKYKGLDVLLRAYSSVELACLNLVIAGKGVFSDEEKMLLSEMGKVTVINRYISDAEMVYLFTHAKVLVLPYREATQSGVIPIAYKFAKPVITSDEKGLTQFVEDGKTGMICKSISDFRSAFVHFTELSEVEYGKMCRNAQQYYNKNLSWKENLNKLFQEIGETK